MSPAIRLRNSTPSAVELTARSVPPAPEYEEGTSLRSTKAWTVLGAVPGRHLSSAASKTRDWPSVGSVSREMALAERVRSESAMNASAPAVALRLTDAAMMREGDGVDSTAVPSVPSARTIVAVIFIRRKSAGRDDQKVVETNDIGLRARDEIIGVDVAGHDLERDRAIPLFRDRRRDFELGQAIAHLDIGVARVGPSLGPAVCGRADDDERLDIGGRDRVIVVVGNIEAENEIFALLDGGGGAAPSGRCQT